MAPLPTEEDMGYEDMDYGACHLERLLGASALSLIVENNKEGLQFQYRIFALGLGCVVEGVAETVSLLL